MSDCDMEDLIITAEEHKILQKCRKLLKKRFNVKVQMPNVVTSTQSDMIFVSVSGKTRDRERAKKFLSQKANKTHEKVGCQENIVLVTLSDSEDERMTSEESTDSTVHHLDDSVCIIETRGIADNSSKSVRKEENGELGIDKTKWRSNDDSICIIETCDNYSKKDERKTESKDNLEDVELCEVSSTTEEYCSVPPQEKHIAWCEHTAAAAPTITLPHTTSHRHTTNPEPSPSTSWDPYGQVQTFRQDPPSDVQKKRKNVLAEEFIPLHKTKKAKLTKEKKDEVLIIENAVRPLRPIVIDGCNVAMEHGKTSNTFSAKGIKLAVDYFLNRGHTQVTAFVPRFRRFCNRKHCPTTDPELLDDLAKKQQVVFTPSRRVNGKCIVSYDDRFIVQLASANGGVILSNDNYRDLISENDSFKEVIENRLLLFCFVGDMLMVPADPMGRAGPTLDQFLSFPPDTGKT